MYTLVVLLTTFLGSQAISNQALIQEHWKQFKIEYGKKYQSETEEQYRLGVYMKNFDKINEHNKLYEMGRTSYEIGMNQFGDLPEDEFLRLYTVDMPELPEDLSASEPWSSIKDNLPQSMQDFFIFAPLVRLENVPDLPEVIDWRSHGVITDVKNQGTCRACWSFSATGALEAQWRLHKSEQLISLSEQNLIDCSSKYGNVGCEGGRIHWAFRYIKENGGIESEVAYPYKALKGQCVYNSQNKTATVSRVMLIRPGETQLKIKVGTTGPMSVAAEVGHNFRFYRSGVYNEPNCGFNLSHSMLAVGYGSLGKNKYWLVKNSWGIGWGDHGYIRMSREKNNQCGIASMASYPVV